jgi:dipeptidyl aminopeptidase/acylaminoacyl peptidase
VVDGVEGDGYDSALAASAITFSPDGRRIAYVAHKGDQEVVVADGVAGGKYDGIISLVFSRDGQRVAYAGYRGPRISLGAAYSCYAVVDGVQGPEYKCDGVWMSGLRFSPDGRRATYVAPVVKGGKCRWCTVVDGIAGPPCEGIAMDGVAFSADGQRTAYFALKGLRWSLDWFLYKKSMAVVDGVAGPEYDSGPQGAIAFSADGRRVAYRATKGQKRLVVVDGVPGPAYDDISSGSVFSADGQHVAYGAQKGQKWVVVMDGAEGPECDGSLLSGPVLRDGGVLEALALRSGNLYRVRHLPVAQ